MEPSCPIGAEIFLMIERIISCSIQLDFKIPERLHGHPAREIFKLRGNISVVERGIGSYPVICNSSGTNIRLASENKTCSGCIGISPVLSQVFGFGFKSG